MAPRPRSFDEGVALGRAKDLFWALGYEATSMQNLVDHMGIGRQSLYNTYGDKHHLYMRSLELYQSENHGRMLEPLAAPTAGLPEVRAFLMGVATSLGAQEDRRACFLVNALMELSPRDEAVLALGRRHRKTLLGHLTAILERSAGLLRPGMTPAAAAALVAHSAMGLSVTWKTGATPEELVALAETTLDAVIGNRESALAG